MGHAISMCGTIQGQYKAAHGGTQMWHHLGSLEKGGMVSGVVALK